MMCLVWVFLSSPYLEFVELFVHLYSYLLSNLGCLKSLFLQYFISFFLFFLGSPQCICQSAWWCPIGHLSSVHFSSTFFLSVLSDFHCPLFKFTYSFLLLLFLLKYAFEFFQWIFFLFQLFYFAAPVFLSGSFLVFTFLNCYFHFTNTSFSCLFPYLPLVLWASSW